MAVRKPFVIFVILATYILLQFAWWAFLIYEQGLLIHGLERGIEVPDHRKYSLWMILSEGGVFTIIVTVLLYLAYRGYKRELQLVRAKDNFLMAVTHELRTPIAGMRLNMQTLQRKGLDDDKRELLLANAITDTKRLQELSDRILLAAKSDEELIAVTSKDVDLSELTKELVLKSSQDHQKTHELDANIEEGIIVFMDPLGYSSILLNLIQNASKYSAPGSVIGISLIKKDTEVLLSVSDQGEGISDEDRKKIFDKFYRSGNENTRRTQGTGLGLYIVKRFTKRFGGNITVVDNKPNGSVFQIALPRKISE